MLNQPKLLTESNRLDTLDSMLGTHSKSDRKGTSKEKSTEKKPRFSFWKRPAPRKRSGSRDMSDPLLLDRKANIKTLYKPIMISKRVHSTLYRELKVDEDKGRYSEEVRIVLQQMA